MTGDPARAREAVRITELRKVYASDKGDIVALERIDVSVHDREFVSILGPSGCGKSTLLMIVAGLVKPTEGRVEVQGRPVLRPVTDVGIVFQRDLLFDWRTVLGNVMLQADVRGLDREAARVKARHLLESVGLGEFTDRHPWELSGGMRQRVAICRALLYDAPLLLLDEPFGALDALTRDQMNLDLQRIWSADRRTALFITHSISEAIFLADRVIVMSPRPGRIVSDIRVELARPRRLDVRETPRFTEHVRELRTIIEGMGVLH